jgi:hypothetical protein
MASASPHAAHAVLVCMVCVCVSAYAMFAHCMRYLPAGSVRGVSVEDRDSAHVFQIQNSRSPPPFKNGKPLKYKERCAALFPLSKMKHGT